MHVRIVAVAAAALALTAPSALAARDEPRPIDPQTVVRQERMTWDDYVRVPGVNWEDRSRQPSQRTFKGALVLADFPDRDFFVTKPKGSTVFGNPIYAHDVPRDQVASFYERLLGTPGGLNRGHTINGFWMENSGGRYGVDLKAFGPYRLPGKSYSYFINSWGNPCPQGVMCRNFRQELNAAFRADVGDEVADQYDFVFYVSAGQDHNATWLEFGQGKFATKESVPDEFGPPAELKQLDPTLTNFAKTRYVEWTSWAAASNVWPSAGGGVSNQAESTGAGTYSHEFTHILGISDNYTNPYGNSRQYAGHYDLISRGHDVGPGGVHTRWHIPSIDGSSAGSHHGLRNKIDLGIVDEANVLRLTREALADSGVVVAKVTAREVLPGASGLTGVNVAMTAGDKSPPCTLEQDYRCDRGGYNNYTVEVVDRMGADSFQTDHGVLLSKTKDQDRAPFIWAIDAKPDDIGQVDFIKPDGTPEMIPKGDARQLSDALFHAGTDSGTVYEYEDAANRLRFYVLDVERDWRGVLSYTVAVRSLDGAGPQARGAKLGRPSKRGIRPARTARCTFPLRNTGQAGSSAGHPEDVARYADSDVYRLSTRTSGRRWSAWVPSETVAARAGRTIDVPVYAQRRSGGSPFAEVELTARSESDPRAAAKATCRLSVLDTIR